MEAIAAVTVLVRGPDRVQDRDPSPTRVATPNRAPKVATAAQVEVGAAAALPEADRDHQVRPPLPRRRGDRPHPPQPNLLPNGKYWFGVSHAPHTDKTFVFIFVWS